MRLKCMLDEKIAMNMNYEHDDDNNSHWMTSFATQNAVCFLIFLSLFREWTQLECFSINVSLSLRFSHTVCLYVCLLACFFFPANEMKWKMKHIAAVYGDKCTERRCFCNIRTLWVLPLKISKFILFWKFFSKLLLFHHRHPPKFTYFVLLSIVFAFFGLFFPLKTWVRNEPIRRTYTKTVLCKLLTSGMKKQ